MPSLATSAFAYPGDEVASGRHGPDVLSYQIAGYRGGSVERVRHSVHQRPDRHRRTEAHRVRPRNHGQARQLHAASRKMAAVDRTGRTAMGMRYSVGGPSLVAEARRWIGTNPTGRSSLWCGHFMNLVLKRTGHQGSPSNMARSFAAYGHRLSGPRVGAIAVMSRGRRGGHVGIVSGIDSTGNPIIISGNHGRRVAESVYPRGRIYAYVMP
jgi:uncharacterized protein (TIGR02594 family)